MNRLVVTVVGIGYLKPWLLAQIRHDLTGQDSVRFEKTVDLPSLVGEHYDAILEFYGHDLGIRVARKHLGWYMDQVQTPRAMRSEILRSKDSKFVHHALTSALTETEIAA